MLFLHALIFFVLGTSVVAIPVPGNQQYQPDREYGRLDGWWKEHPREDKKPEHLMLIKDKKIVTFHPNDVEESQLNSESWYHDTIWGRSEGPNGSAGTVKMEHPHDLVVIEGMNTKPERKNYLTLSFHYGALGPGGMPGMQIRLDVELDLPKKSGPQHSTAKKVDH